jgi:hypothetical protein
MSIERFFLEGYRDEAEYDKLKESLVFPLVRELEFKYGLKVAHRTQIQDTKYGDWLGNIDAWMMCHKNGIAVGKAYVIKNMDGKDEYAWRSPFYKKERGENLADKETIRSIKISSLMATLTRQSVVPTALTMEQKKLKNVKSAIDLFQKSFGSSYKSMDLTSNEVHALLLMALGKSPNSEWVAIDQNKCIETLDKWENADIVAKEKREEQMRFFTSPFFMIGVDDLGDHLIGKFKLVQVKEDSMQYETIEPFRRYRTYEEVPELIPVMTMTKVAYEDKNCVMHSAIPRTDAYNPDLDAVFFYNTAPTHYDHVWMVTPCPI